MDVRRWTTGGQLASELPLQQKDCRCQWLYSPGTGFWAKVQLFPGLLASAPIITCCAWWWALFNWPLLPLWVFEEAGSTGGIWSLSPRPASRTPYCSRGEGPWESTMALGFIGCEEHERFILRFLCCLREHFHFSTPALSPSFESVFQGRAPSRHASRGCDWIHWKLPSQDLLWDVKGLETRLEGVSPSTLQIL